MYTESHGDESALTAEKPLVFSKVTDPEFKKIFDYNDDYLHFLDASKTERLCCAEAVRQAEKAGFRPLSEFRSLAPGDKVYVNERNKAVIFYRIGTEAVTDGMNIVGAHIDSPRLDLKPSPLYESDDLALFKTHYYGGIKKYQWVALPLALYGTVVLKDGTKISLSIGDRESEPVFCVSDLLIHLAGKQMAKKAAEVIEGEELNLLVGSIPVKDEDVKEAVKKNILKKLQKEYGFTEADFASAEFEAVPAGKARSVGFDESLVGAYAQDDRVCAYAALRGILDLYETPARTACVILADKEEIGSVGSTGMNSRMFENDTAEICALLGETDTNLAVRRTLRNSACLSADVTAGYDPTFASAFDPLNSAFIGKGAAICKYGGARGKSGSNDAHPEFLAKLRGIFDDAGVFWQTCDMGKVDQGGGGTIAYMLAAYGMDVVDCGTAVLSMHSPFEISSKADTYMTWKAYNTFLIKY